MPKSKPPKPSEHAIQASFIEWVGVARNQHQVLYLLHAIPNGAALAGARLKDGKWTTGFKQAQKLKREGLRPGMPDIHLPVSSPDAEYIGLWLEFKRKGERMTEEQALIAGLLQDFGHRVEVVRSAAQAIAVTEEYLGVPPEERTQHWGIE